MSKTRPTENLVSVGTATTALILNGLGFSNRQRYLVNVEGTYIQQPVWFQYDEVEIVSLNELDALTNLSARQQ